MGLFDKLKKKKDKENEYIKIDAKPLLDWNENEGCIVSDMITKEGWKVGYMCRGEALSNYPDSGWRFFKGDEDEGYSSDVSKHHIFALNTICNYDPDIIPYLNAPVGSAFIRVSEKQFEPDDGEKPIFMMKQNRDDMEEL